MIRAVIDRYMCTHEENQLRADRLIRAVIDRPYISAIQDPDFPSDSPCAVYDRTILLRAVIGRPYKLWSRGMQAPNSIGHDIEKPQDQERE